MSIVFEGNERMSKSHFTGDNINSGNLHWNVYSLGHRCISRNMLIFRSNLISEFRWLNHGTMKLKPKK